MRVRVSKAFSVAKSESAEVRLVLRVELGYAVSVLIELAGRLLEQLKLASHHC
jgi:hypothetical protein